MCWTRRLLINAMPRLQPITIAQSTLSQEGDQLAPSFCIKAIDIADELSFTTMYQLH
jgi:hypothetical protein